MKEIFSEWFFFYFWSLRLKVRKVAAVLTTKEKPENGH